MALSKTQRNRTNNLLKKLAGVRAKPKTASKCTRCGCDDDHRCQPTGCWWVKGLVDVCSECATVSELNRDGMAFSKLGKRAPR